MCQQCWKFLKRFEQVSLHAQRRKIQIKGSHQQRRYACTTDAHHNVCMTLSFATTRLTLLSVSQGNAATHGWPRPLQVQMHAHVVSTESQYDDYYAIVLTSVLWASRLHGIVYHCVWVELTHNGTQQPTAAVVQWCDDVARVQSLTIQNWMFRPSREFSGSREWRNAPMDTADVPVVS